MVTQILLRMCKEKSALDLNKFLTQSKLQISHHMCAPISEIPSNISTIILITYHMILFGVTYHEDPKGGPDIIP